MNGQSEQPLQQPDNEKSMRICWIHPTTQSTALAPLWDALERTVTPGLSRDTVVEHRFPAHSGNFTRSLYAEHLNSVLMVDEATRAERDGFDGVFFGCWNDPLWEAREVLTIPVASVGEQSMLAALAMGQRFAVVTVSEKTAVAIERDLLLYGLRDRAIHRPVRSIAPESDAALLLAAVSGAHDEAVSRIDAVARTCVADGADIVLVGCAYYGPLLRRAGYTHVCGTGVPVIDSTTVAIKYLEAMVGVARATGVVKTGGPIFRSPAPERLAQARLALAVPVDGDSRERPSCGTRQAGKNADRNLCGGQ